MSPAPEGYPVSLEEDSNMVLFIPAVVLLAMGWLIKYKKVTWLISGYNTASRQEKERYDIERLCKYMGNFLFVLAGMFLVLAALIVLFAEHSTYITSMGVVVLAVAMVFGVVYLNTGNRVRKQ